jgi:hypothetical protein
MTEVIIEFTQTYAQALDSNDRLRKLVYPPKLRWPEYLWVPVFFVGPMVAAGLSSAVGEMARRFGGNAAQFWAWLLTFIILVIASTWLWFRIIRSRTRTHAIRWLEKTYGPPEAIRVTAIASGVTWETDTYAMSTKWSGMRAVEIIDDGLLVRGVGLNFLLERDVFSGPSHIEEVAAKLRERWAAAGSA